MISVQEFKAESRILNRARNARCNRTLTLILSLTGRGEESRTGLRKAPSNKGRLGSEGCA
jgi:hypothetical protein